MYLLKKEIIKIQIYNVTLSNSYVTRKGEKKGRKRGREKGERKGDYRGYIRGK
jgi:hypothetical protein